MLADNDFLLALDNLTTTSLLLTLEERRKMISVVAHGWKVRICSLETDLILYRACKLDRSIATKEDVWYPPDKIKTSIKSGRMNLENQQVMYTSTSINGCLLEAKLELGDKVVVSEIKIKKGEIVEVVPVGLNSELYPVYKDVVDTSLFSPREKQINNFFTEQTIRYKKDGSDYNNSSQIAQLCYDCSAHAIMYPCVERLGEQHTTNIVFRKDYADSKLVLSKVMLFEIYRPPPYKSGGMLIVPNQEAKLISTHDIDELDPNRLPKTFK